MFPLRDPASPPSLPPGHTDGHVTDGHAPGRPQPPPPPGPHLLLALAAEAQAGRPLLVAVPVVGARLVGLELHHPPLRGGGWGGRGGEEGTGGKGGGGRRGPRPRGRGRAGWRRREGPAGAPARGGRAGKDGGDGGGPPPRDSLFLGLRSVSRRPGAARYALPPFARLIPPFTSSRSAATASAPATANDDDRDAILGNATQTA